MPRPMSCPYFPQSCSIRIGITILSIALLLRRRITTALFSDTHLRGLMGQLSGQLHRIAPMSARPCTLGISQARSLRW